MKISSYYWAQKRGYEVVKLPEPPLGLNECRQCGHARAHHAGGPYPRVGTGGLTFDRSSRCRRSKPRPDMREARAPRSSGRVSGSLPAAIAADMPMIAHWGRRCQEAVPKRLSGLLEAESGFNDACVATFWPLRKPRRNERPACS
jgi:hypothetical protein